MNKSRYMAEIKTLPDVRKVTEVWGSKELLRLIGQIPRYRLFLLIVLIVSSSLAEGLGILLLVPLIGLLSDNVSATASLAEPALAAAVSSPALLLAGFAALMIARALLQQWHQSEAAALQRKIIEDLRLSATHAILHAEWRWLSAQRISENSAVLLSDLARLGWGIGYIATLASAAASIAVYLTVSFILSWSATLLALAFGVAAYAAAARYRRRIVALGEAIGSSNTALHQQIEETLAGAKLIKSLGREQAKIAALGDVLTTLDSQHRQVVANAGKARTLIDSTSAVFLAVLTYAALAWLHVPAEWLLPLIIVFARFVPLLAGAQQGILHWLNAVPALRRVTDIIDEAAARAEPTASGVPVRVTKSISVDAASFTYSGSDLPALANISLALPAPGTTAITGPSGVGKSTLADILGGLIELDTGRLLIDGIAVEGRGRVKWRQSVAYVHQDAFFFDGTIAENLRMAKPSASDDDLRKALASVAAGFVDNRPEGLATRMGASGKHFSGGERQRLALARALLAAPALLILDEATSALDPETEAAVVVTIEALRGRTTILVISHRPISGLTVDQRVILDESSGCDSAVTVHNMR